MGIEKNNLQAQDGKLEQVDEMVADIVSLVILLENDMEAQKADCIHIRILKMVHGALKDMQKKLSAYMQQEKGQPENKD